MTPPDPARPAAGPAAPARPDSAPPAPARPDSAPPDTAPAELTRADLAPPDPAPPGVEPPDLAERALIRRKREDAALVMPVLGVLLLVSPLLNIFAGPSRILGMPAAFVWIFVAWAGLILVTRGLARRLTRDGDRG